MRWWRSKGHFPVIFRDGGGGNDGAHAVIVREGAGPSATRGVRQAVILREGGGSSATRGDAESGSPWIPAGTHCRVRISCSTVAKLSSWFKADPRRICVLGVWMYLAGCGICFLSIATSAPAAGLLTG